MDIRRHKGDTSNLPSPWHSDFAASYTGHWSLSVRLMKNAARPIASASPAHQPRSPQHHWISAYNQQIRKSRRITRRQHIPLHLSLLLYSLSCPIRACAVEPGEGLKNCLPKVIVDAADRFYTCALSAGLITKLRELCPLPCGLFFSLQLDRKCANWSVLSTIFQP
mgnify:CR=1 FL=1